MFLISIAMRKSVHYVKLILIFLFLRRIRLAVDIPQVSTKHFLQFGRQFLSTKFICALFSYAFSYNYNYSESLYPSVLLIIAHLLYIKSVLIFF